MFESGDLNYGQPFHKKLGRTRDKQLPPDEREDKSLSGTYIGPRASVFTGAACSHAAS